MPHLIFLPVDDTVHRSITWWSHFFNITCKMTLTRVLCTAALLVMLCGSQLAVCDLDVVQVSGGSVLGVRNTTLGVRYWKGIPFGESTAGANRFMPPLPRTPWTGVLNCTVYAPGCVSDHHGLDTAPVQSEDCLNINVFVPINASRQVR